MFEMKKLNLPEITVEKSKTYAQKLVDSAVYLLKVSVIYPIQDQFYIYRERIGRSLAFAKLGWKNYDFDSGYLWEVMEFKLKRIRNTLKKGHAVQKKEDMAALSKLIKIVERLGEDRYEQKYYKALDKKWGKSKLVFGKKDENGHIEMSSSRPKRVTEKNKKDYRKDLLNTSVLAMKDRNADLDEMNKILKNHQRAWWD